jgi:hypothetical protein
MNPISRKELLAGTLAGGGAGAAAVCARSPNVLLVMTDQHRGDAMGACGKEVIHRPNLDSLAKSGVLFTECQAQHPIGLGER